MTVEEIRVIAIDSAKAYYDYLNKNEKGVQEIDVLEIHYLASRDLLIKLRLSAKLFDTEAIFFKNFKKGKKYDVSEIKVIEYDSDRNILLIKPANEITSEFLNLNNSDLKVISDLKFLVQRVRTWYELNGAKIGLPTIKSKLYDKTEEITYFSEKQYQPSINQQESIKNIFLQPFSYVWGAPGTGKTQFVLSYVALHYINNGYKIAILAPTNNSIEQVLRGVIDMTDKAGIDRKQIIRLGTPSRKFAEQFPEVCEEKGVQKNLDELDRQINILERMIVYEQAMMQLESFKSNLVDFEHIPILIANFKKSKDIFEEEAKQKKRKEIDLKFCEEEKLILVKRKEKEAKRLTSFRNRLKKLFSSKPTKTENVISQLEFQVKEKWKEVEFFKYEIDEIGKSFIEKKNVKEKAQSSVEKQFAFIIDKFKNYPKFAAILRDLEENNWKEKKLELAREISNDREMRNIDAHLFADYKHVSVSQLQYELSSYLQLRNKLFLFSTEERLKSVNVIACTLDGYIGRYSETKLNVEHIFLDEAGYANIIKAMTLLNHSVPISFLGDHMQLPPVCEINDSEIRGGVSFRNMFLWAQSAIHLEFLFSHTRDICLNQYLSNLPFKSINLKQTSLDSTFRFGSNLAAILGRYVYSNNFSSSNPIEETQIFFVDAKKSEPLFSRESFNEVTAIKAIAENLKKLSKPHDFVVLTPYKKQIRLLNKGLPEERNELKILTVHGSQGREWDTVILSVVDTSDAFFVDTKKDVSKGLKLVNTAVSRAKKRLIIVCDKSYWMKQDGQLITDLLKSGTEQNAYECGATDAQ